MTIKKFKLKAKNDNKTENKKMLRKQLFRFGISFLSVFVLVFGVVQTRALAAGINIGVNTENGGALGTLELMFMLMLISLAPSILIMMTSFTRIIIILSFLRNAMGTQQSPPNQVLIGLALFLSLFIMTPVLTEINNTALDPMRAGTITQDVAIERASVTVKKFMLEQTKPKDLNLFLELAGKTEDIVVTEETSIDELAQELGLEVVVPSFITSELGRAFLVGFLLFIPFLIIDMVVSSTLMSMGMVMLPPSMIALPFKLMMFVLVDGWNLLFGMLVKGFQV